MKSDTTNYQKQLLNASIMDDEEHEIYLKNRKHFNQWQIT
jgi:hypothetical protein